MTASTRENLKATRIESLLVIVLAIFLVVIIPLLAVLWVEWLEILNEWVFGGE